MVVVRVPVRRRRAPAQPAFRADRLDHLPRRWRQARRPAPRRSVVRRLPAGPLQAARGSPDPGTARVRLAHRPIPAPGRSGRRAEGPAVPGCRPTEPSPAAQLAGGATGAGAATGGGGAGTGGGEAGATGGVGAAAGVDTAAGGDGAAVPPVGAGPASAGGDHDGPSSPGISNRPSADEESSAFAASYELAIDAIVARTAFSQSIRMSLSTKGFTWTSTSSLAAARSPAPVMTVCDADSQAGRSPCRRSSIDVTAATLPSTIPHRLSRRPASASAAVRAVAATDAAASVCRRRKSVAVSAPAPLHAVANKSTCTRCTRSTSWAAPATASNADRSASSACRSKPSSVPNQSRTCAECSVKSGFW